MGIAKLGKQVKEHKVFVIVPMVILIIVALARTFIWRDYTNERVEMAIYLKDKYGGQEFVVGKPVREGAMFAIEGHLTAVAYPVNNKKIKFDVMYSSTGKLDGYAGAIWSNEESERLKPKIYRLFGNGTDYTVEVQSSMSLHTMNIDVRGKVPTFKDAVKKYGKQIPYGLTIKKLKRSLSDDEKEDIVNKLIEISTLLLDETDVTIKYFSRFDKVNRYGLIIRLDDLRKLNSRQDKINMFEGWRAGGWQI